MSYLKYLVYFSQVQLVINQEGSYNFRGNDAHDLSKRGSFHTLYLREFVTLLEMSFIIMDMLRFSGP